MWDLIVSVTDHCLSFYFDAIHIEAAITNTGATKLYSMDKLLSELGWETLQSRRDKHKLVISIK